MGINVTNKVMSNKGKCEEKYKSKFYSRCPDDCGIIITQYTNWKDSYKSFTIHHAYNCKAGDEEYDKGLTEWQENDGFQIIKKKVPQCQCGADKVKTTHSDWCVKYDSNR